MLSEWTRAYKPQCSMPINRFKCSRWGVVFSLISAHMRHVVLHLNIFVQRVAPCIYCRMACRYIFMFWKIVCQLISINMPKKLHSLHCDIHFQIKSNCCVNIIALLTQHHASFATRLSFSGCNHQLRFQCGHQKKFYLS